MLGRIALLALRRRARWVVIGAWVALAVALAGFQPKLQKLAGDGSAMFRTRCADSTRVHSLLDTRFEEGGDSTAVIAFVAREGSIYTHAPFSIEAMQTS